MRTHGLAWLALLAAGACSNQTTTTNDTASPGDVETYQSLVEELDAAVERYGEEMRANGAASCSSIHAHYYQQVSPWLAEMGQMSGAMDEFLHAHGAGAVADMTCMASLMLQELDRHHAVACTYADPAEDLTEVDRHVGLMHDYDEHVLYRCQEMMWGYDGGMPPRDPMANGCYHWGEGGYGGMHQGYGGMHQGYGGMHQGYGGMHQGYGGMHHGW